MLSVNIAECATMARTVAGSSGGKPDYGLHQPGRVEQGDTENGG